jgi:hypothetical protein
MYMLKFGLMAMKNRKKIQNKFILYIMFREQLQNSANGKKGNMQMKSQQFVNPQSIF